MRRIALAILLMIGSAVGGAYAQDWGGVATISSTMGVGANRLCIGESSRGDLGCPTYAPSLTTAGDLISTGGLTISTVSLTTAGTTWGYLSSAASYIPNLGSNAISTTNISATTINGLPVSSLGGGASPTNVPTFRASKSGVDQTVTASTWTKVTLGAKDFDNYSGFNTSTSRFTPTVAGYYYITASLACSTTCYAAIYKNGSLVNYGGGNSTGVSQASGVIYMNGSTDYIEEYGNTNTTTFSGTSTASYLTGTLVASGNGLVSGTGVSALSALTDVNVSVPTSGTVLTYNGTSSKWEALAATGGLGYAIISGTTAVTVNSTTSVISLTTAGTTWGYLSSAASYLPKFTAGSISTTTVQVSGTTAVCGSTNAGTIRYTSATTTLELCTGSGWQPMGVGIPAGTISAFASTTCPTGWSEYTAARGRFLRGIDNGAGNDPSGTRTPGDIQDDLLKSHTHSVVTQLSGAIGSNGSALSGNAAGGWQNPSTASGGAETRPKNVAVTFCQFNGTSNGWNNPLSGGSTVPGGSTGQIQYNTSGSFDGNAGLTWTNGTQTLAATNISSTNISVTTINGLPFTGSGAGTGYSITSGTTAVTVNSGTSNISLTTVSTTWGYLGSTASYIPNLGTNAISTTNISATTINGVSISSLGGGTSPTNVPAFRANKGGTNQTVTAGTLTKLTFSTKVFDTQSNFDTSTSRFTPTVAGRYLVHLQAYCSDGSTAYCEAHVRKNGVDATVSHSRSSVGDISGNATGIVDMNGTTDYLEGYAVNSGGTTISGAITNSYFEASLLASGNGLVSGTGVSALSALTDVNVTTPTSGTVLTYNGTSSKWEALAATGGLGYAITSGTTAVTVNSSTSVISLTTAGTTWGYLGSAASYIPNLTSNAISATTINGVSVSSYIFSSSSIPAFKVDKNGTAQTGITASTYTKITFSNKVLDTQNNFNTSTSRFTPTVAGSYIFTGSVYCGSAAACWVSVYKNGVIQSQSGNNNNAATNGALPTTAIVLPMNGSTDYVELWVYTSSNSLSGNAEYTNFSGSLLGGVGSSSGSSGTGVTALSALTDVTLSSPTSNSILVYDGSKWVNKFIQDTVSTSTMVASWPDAITCTISGVDYIFPVVRAVSGGGALYKYESGSSIWNVAFSNISANGDTSGSNSTISNCTTTISSLYASGRAYNYIGGSGSGSGGSGYGLVSGSLGLTLNSPTSIISLSTAGTTWGYLGSATSYLPNLTTNALTVGGLTINSTTLTSNTAQVAFSVHKNGTAQTITAGTATKLTWSTKVFDTNNNFDLATGRFTPTVAGKYIITLSNYCGGSTTACYSHVYKNGALVQTFYQATSAGIPVGSVIVDMNGTTDYIEGYTQNTGGTSVSGNITFTFFQGALLGGNGSGSSGTGATPAGATGQVQYNTSGALDASPNFTFTSSTQTLSTTNVTANILKLNDNSTSVCDATSYNSMKVVNGRIYLCVNR